MPKAPPIPPKPHLIEILAFDEAQLLDIAGPLQVFASANEQLELAGRAPFYRLRPIARSRRVTTSSGLQLRLGTLTERNPPVDTLIVSGGRGVHTARRDQRLLPWIKRRAAVAKRIVSICSGAYLLGEAGVLDGRRATTHWAECRNLARAFPKARVEANAIFIQDGPVWTSGGVTAGIDLALALVAADCGQLIAHAVARDLVVFIRRSGDQAQFSELLALQHQSSDFDELHAWIAGHLGGDLSTPVLASRARMSERTFQRRYREQVGVTPARAVERMRIETARQLLTGTERPIKQIAKACGYGTEETMRRSFQRQLHTTPQDYRRHFSTRR